MTNEEKVNEFALEALAVMSKVLQANQNIRGIILHYNELKEVATKGMNTPLSIRYDDAGKDG